MRITLLVPLLLAVATNVFSNSKAQERKVQDNIITSERDPKVRIHLPKSVQYVGADRWVLYDMADCELHAFVDADQQKNVNRLYWVQFEGYLPTRPKLKHQYDSPRHTTIDGLDFYVDTWVESNDVREKPGSDGEHIEALLRAKGYRLPAGMICVRLVHLLDKQKRKELMIIYGEDAASTGHTAAELRKGGTAHQRWPTIEKGLIERAEKSVSIN
jgi:hypothetical protein